MRVWMSLYQLAFSSKCSLHLCATPVSYTCVCTPLAYTHTLFHPAFVRPQPKPGCAAFVAAGPPPFLASSCLKLEPSKDECKSDHTMKIIPYRTIPCHAMPCHAMPYHTIPYRTIPYQNHTTPYHTMPCHALPYHTVPYHTKIIPHNGKDELKLKSTGQTGSEQCLDQPIVLGLLSGREHHFEGLQSLFGS